MTALTAATAAKRFRSADTLPPLILVFGPDRGLVTETAAHLAALAGNSDDPFAAVRLDATAVTQDPARLVDEARTVSLFGGRRLIHVRDGASKNLAPAVAPLLAEPPTDAIVIVEAGDLRRGTGLRKQVEDHASAAAVYCPPDGEKELARMIDEEVAGLGLSMDADARALLVENLGADRAASRAEVLKVALHALDGSGIVSVADVEAVASDIAVSAMSEAVEAAFMGQRGTADALITRLMAESAPSSLLMVAQRTAHAYELAAASVARGTAPARAVDGLRPPLYGARKAAAARILERWSPGALRRASAAIAAATFATRTQPGLAKDVTRITLLRIAAEAGRRTPRADA